MSVSQLAPSPVTGSKTSDAHEGVTMTLSHRQMPRHVELYMITCNQLVVVRLCLT